MSVDEQLLRKLRRVDEESTAMVRDFIITEIQTCSTILNLAKTEFGLGEQKRGVELMDKAVTALSEGLRWLNEGEKRGMQLDDLRLELAQLEVRIQDLPENSNA